MLTGLDFDHAKLAISELARYHAVGIALKNKKPDVFKEAAKYMTIYPFDMEDSEFKEIIDHTVELICQDSRIAKYEGRIKETYLESRNWKSFVEFEAVEPWVTINHGDFWVNNIMYRHGKLIFNHLNFY